MLLGCPAIFQNKIQELFKVFQVVGHPNSVSKYSNLDALILDIQLSITLNILINLMIFFQFNMFLVQDKSFKNFEPFFRTVKFLSRKYNAPPKNSRYKLYIRTW